MAHLTGEVKSFFGKDIAVTHDLLATSFSFGNAI
jgi:hypothetical protein